MAKAIVLSGNLHNYAGGSDYALCMDPNRDPDRRGKRYESLDQVIGRNLAQNGGTFGPAGLNGLPVKITIEIDE